jgi:hypothetical protein
MFVRPGMRRFVGVAFMALTLCARPMPSASAGPGSSAQRCNARNYTVFFWPHGHSAQASALIPESSSPIGALFVGPVRRHPRPQLLAWFGPQSGSGSGPQLKGVSCAGSALPVEVAAPTSPKSSSEPGLLKCSFAVPPLTKTRLDSHDGFETGLTFTMIEGHTAAVVESLTNPTSTMTYDPKMCRFTTVAPGH